jgi:CPA2 family monovalent cation:H+ antiporter-2
MHEALFLEDLVVVLAAALLAVLVLGRLRVPSIAGFIVAGVLVGPGALGLVDDVGQVETLAEVGIVLLLFGVGLELSLDRIRRLWRPVLVGGALQVGITALSASGVALVFGLPAAKAVFVGFVIAVSSTAIVLRGLSSRGQLDAPHGQLAVGILIFQDLCVVPMMLALPLLAGTGGTKTEAALGALIALAALGAALVAARTLVPPLLRAASRTRQREVFVLAVAVICLGIAWLLSLAGVSVALGAFIAGLVVSGSEFRHQALSDVVPLREILAGVFFVSVGMLLDTSGVGGKIGPVLALLVAILAGKFLLVLLAALLMRKPQRTAVLAAAALCQVGEFAFVLLAGGREQGLIEEPLGGNLVVAAILSMLVTPFLIRVGPHLVHGARRIGGLKWIALPPNLEEPPGDGDGVELSDHVIVAGYGLAGQELARALEHRDVPYVVVDINVDNVRLARSEGMRAYFGDVTSAELLAHVGVQRARELVISVNDADASERAVRFARAAAPGLRIIVRTAYAIDVPRLQAAGASEVVTAEVEAAVEIVYLILKGRRTGGAELTARLEAIRDRRAGGD